MGMTPPLPTPPWRGQAACRGGNTGIWFHESSDDRTASQALAVCTNCPVIDSCQTVSMGNADEVGISGGLTEWQCRRGRGEQLT